MSDPTTPTAAMFTKWLHEWFEREAVDGCLHYDKGHGPYRSCEDFDAHYISTLLAALPEGAVVVTVETLAAAAREAGRTNRYIGYLDTDDCRLIIQAAKEAEGEG